MRVEIKALNLKPDGSYWLSRGRPHELLHPGIVQAKAPEENQRWSFEDEASNSKWHAPFLFSDEVTPGLQCSNTVASEYPSAVVTTVRGLTQQGTNLVSLPFANILQHLWHTRQASSWRVTAFFDEL